MRIAVQENVIHALFKELAQRAKGPGRIYVTGGTTAVLLRWRDSTADVDLKLFPEPAGVFEAIRDVKELLKVNIELASPDDFIPAVPGWEERSRFIVGYNGVEFYHYDFYGQALSKIGRGHVRDVSDVEAMLRLGYIDKENLCRLFCAIEPALIRYPSINPSSFRKKVEAVVGQIF